MESNNHITEKAKNEVDTPKKEPRIRIFKDHDEQREEMYKYWASITPVQRMADLRDLIIMSFGLTPEKIKKAVSSRKITIIYRGE